MPARGVMPRIFKVARRHGPLLQTKQPKKANPPKGGFVLCVKCSVSFRSRK